MSSNRPHQSPVHAPEHPIPLARITLANPKPPRSPSASHPTLNRFFAMKKIYLRSLAASACLLVGNAFQAQTTTITQVTPEEYQRMKDNGELPADNNVRIQVPNTVVQPVNPGVSSSTPNYRPKGGGSTNSCEIWEDPVGCPVANGPSDDFPSQQVNLPFSFDLYGQTYTSCWLNNNGNITFDQAWNTFTANPFPNNQFVMVAPFWADVDTRPDTTHGRVLYCVSDHYARFTWLNVGYYNQNNDKKNSFQLTITDGTSDVIGVGNNVAFSYQEMEWTTGDVSYGPGGEAPVNGFGGAPAVVGANLGDGVGYIQIGLFDHAGTDYNGTSVPSGVGWLSYKDFVFSTEVASPNIAPIASGNVICDTIDVCSGELVEINISFFSPETDQTTTPTFSAPTFPQFNPTLTTGNTATIVGTLIPTDGQLGYNTITFTGTDDGTPPLSQETIVVLNVIPSPGDPPVITGNPIACAGFGTTLSASGDYDDYVWSNGWNGETVLVEPGTYYVEGGTGGCLLVSDPFIVTEAPTPSPVIEGVLFNCGGDPAVLTTDTTYATYQWSNGSTDPSVSVGTGTYSVTVTNAEGCSGTSAAVDVNSANSPDAFFIGNPNAPVFPGTTVVYTNQSNPNGGVITDISWNAGTLGSGSSDSLVVYFSTPGNYLITITVTTADGCTGTYTYTQIVVPTEIIIPNVISPNSDGDNDALVFEGAQYYPNTALHVYNRWGNEVFSSGNYKNTWTPSRDIPDGTYFYVLKLQTGKTFDGSFTLLR